MLLYRSLIVWVQYPERSPDLVALGEVGAGPAIYFAVDTLSSGVMPNGKVTMSTPPL